LIGRSRIDPLKGIGQFFRERIGPVVCFLKLNQPAVLVVRSVLDLLLAPFQP
jgi:hypothetical protein